MEKTQAIIPQMVVTLPREVLCQSTMMHLLLPKHLLGLCNKIEKTIEDNILS